MKLGDLIDRLTDIALPDREVYLVINGVRYDHIDIWWQPIPYHRNQGAVHIGDDPR